MQNNSSLPATVLVIFGITGDLSHRYLLPALAEIANNNRLPDEFKIIGVSRHKVDINQELGGNLECLRPFAQSLQMDVGSPDGYSSLKNIIAEARSSFNSQPEIIFYLSVPPAGVLPIIEHLGNSGLNTSDSKLLLEKPFGTNLESAQKLVADTQKHFPENQVYRIDHYLAKEMAQNIVVFLGSNALFRNAWNCQFIEKIEIEAAEKIGIEGRVNFYEGTGALRDLVQSHLMQLAALTLMDPCNQLFDFSELPLRRLEALKHLKLIDSKVVRGQYEGYTQEVENPDSQTETFVSIGLESTHPRWQGVPVNLITGKNLSEKRTEIRVYFKQKSESEGNLLTLRIQPDEGIVLQLWVKQPGYERKLQKIPLEVTYAKHFERLPDAYEQVLIDAIQSNHSLFASSGEVLASWAVLQPAHDKWQLGSSDIVVYKPGSTSGEVISLAHKDS
jgi:glucose-6-phosphate 1-dehydrogenase